MISLLESEAFRTEYKKYTDAISQFTAAEDREKAKILLGRLINEIKFLDGQHKEMFFSKKVPLRLDESKKKISNLRKELDAFIQQADRN